MVSLRQDLKYGTRILARNPGFTIAAVLTLALGIGTSTTIFCLVDQILFRPLPVKNPEELVILRSPGPNRGRLSSDGDSSESFSYPMYRDLRDRTPVFSGLLARFAVPLSIADSGQVGRANGELVSGNYFETLGVNASIGRVFTQDDDQVPGAHPVVVLSHAYWTSRFGADTGVLNKTLLVNGNLMTIIGVTQAGFSGVQTGQMPDIFIPIAMKARITPNWDGLDNRRDSWLAIIGRLKPGVSRAQAEEILRPFYRPILEEEVQAIKGWSDDMRERFLDKRILLDDGSKGRWILQRETEKPLMVLMITVGLVLLIACVNVASLLIARGAARQREIAIRLALGATRLRLIKQFFVESLVLSLIGGGVGLLAAFLAIKGLVSSIPPSAGILGLSTSIDNRLLAFNCGLSIFTSFLFGLAPGIKTTHHGLEATLREQGASVASNLSQVRFRKILVASQIVLTMILLVSAGLFARSLNNLVRLDFGFRADHLMTFSIAPELNGHSPGRAIELFDQIREGVASLPGVESVSAARIPVFTGSTSGSNITLEGYQADEGKDMQVSQNSVGSNYFATMGIPLLAGREFTTSDVAGSSKVAIINETMARRFFVDRDPIGSRLAFGAGKTIRPDIEIVGVVKDSKHSNLRDEDVPFVYTPYAQARDIGSITFYVRTKQDPSSFAGSLRNEVRLRDSNLPVFDLKTLERQLGESTFYDRFLMLFSVCFGLIAALLASIGLYGVMAYTVTRRTREFGIRLAIGAKRSGIVWLVLREVVVLTLAGLVIGLPAAFAIGRLAESLLFGVKANDLLVFTVTTLLLGCVALLSSYLPARKAAGIDPAVALRYE